MGGSHVANREPALACMYDGHAMPIHEWHNNIMYINTPFMYL
jgi:hypothetical protein